MPAPTRGAAVLRLARKATASVLPQCKTRLRCRYSLRNADSTCARTLPSTLLGDLRMFVIRAPAAESESVGYLSNRPERIALATTSHRWRFSTQEDNWRGRDSFRSPVCSSVWANAVSSARGIEHATRAANRSAAAPRSLGSLNRDSIAAHPPATATLGELRSKCVSRSIAASMTLNCAWSRET